MMHRIGCVALCGLALSRLLCAMDDRPGNMTPGGFPTETPHPLVHAGSTDLWGSVDDLGRSTDDVGTPISLVKPSGKFASQLPKLSIDERVKALGVQTPGVKQDKQEKKSMVKKVGEPLVFTLAGAVVGERIAERYSKKRWVRWCSALIGAAIGFGASFWWVAKRSTHSRPLAKRRVTMPANFLNPPKPNVNPWGI